jgi:glutaminyl-peptide cyclotransferase
MGFHVFCHSTLTNETGKYLVHDWWILYFDQSSMRFSIFVTSVLLLCLLNVHAQLWYNHTQTILKFGKREVGSRGHSATIQYLSQELQKNGFRVTHNKFTQTTVIGNVTFTNIIADYERNFSKPTLILAAHHDSKMIAEFDFLGSTDSVCSCGMILEFAKFFNDKFKSREWITSNFNIQMVIFDGEEAFKSWSFEDSLYGSRHLAQLWEKEQKLKSIGLFILFDLLGAETPNFFSYNYHRTTKTQHFYEMIVQIEKQMNVSKYFTDALLPWDLDDDHIPFGQRNVPVLHIISNPFPPEWHTAEDNLDAIKKVPTNRLMQIFAYFFSKIVKLT